MGLRELALVFPDYFGFIAALEISPGLILFVFLPTLIFESTFNLDAQQLRHNLGAILMLAVPGLILSTAAIGVVVWWATDLPLAAALLLGAIGGSLVLMWLMLTGLRWMRGGETG